MDVIAFSDYLACRIIFLDEVGTIRNGINIFEWSMLMKMEILLLEFRL